MRNRPYGFEIYLVNVKTIRTIAQIFVAFSEKLNFTKTFDILANIVNEYQIVSFLHVLEGWVNLKANKPSRSLQKPLRARKYQQNKLSFRCKFLFRNLS